ncbi:MAG: hypothetical protein Kow0077_29660 [Anaerolineae bacterium]
MLETDSFKVIEVADPERMLDSRSKTALMTVATWGDFYRIGENWYTLQQWRQWQHGRAVNEVNHMGEYNTKLGDVLYVCPPESDDIVCQVQVMEIRMVDIARLTDEEFRELGYASQKDYDRVWGAMSDGSEHGWFMRFVLLSETSEIVQ